MKNSFNIYGKIIDGNNTDHYFMRFNKLSNNVIIYHLIGLLDGNKEKDLKEIKNIFKEEVDHIFFASSDCLEQFVDALGGIKINGNKINGAKALDEIRNNNFELVLSGIVNSLSGIRNPLFTIPGLLCAIKGKCETDLNFTDVVKTVMLEAGDLKDWKAELIEVNSENVNSI